MPRRNYQGQQRDTSIDFTTPAETRRYGKETFGSVVVWPTAQAFVVGACSVAAFLSILVAPAIIGARSFLLGAIIVGIGSLIYGIRNETNYKTMLAWPLLAGVIFWCLWAFSDGLFDLSWSPWHSLLGAGLVVLCCTTTFWIWISLGQRLIQQSLHQERYGWDALARILEWRVKQPAPASRVRPIATNYRVPSLPAVEEYAPPPVPELTETEMFLHVARGYETLARDRLRGARLADGKTLTKNCWYRCTEDLVNRNYLVRDDNGKIGWALGADADVALAAYRRPPPHPDGEWTDG